jgi:hypothetical protein
MKLKYPLLAVLSCCAVLSACNRNSTAPSSSADTATGASAPASSDSTATPAAGTSTPTYPNSTTPNPGSPPPPVDDKRPADPTAPGARP